jgi:hypothetical protein
VQVYKSVSTPRCLLLSLVFVVAGGCKLEIAVPDGGKVISKSGNYECLSGEKCSIDIYDYFFKEEFVARPTTEGYLFSHWRKKTRAFCGNETKNLCTIDSSHSALHPNLTQILYSDETFYLEPVFAKPDTWLQSGNDIAGKSVADYIGYSVSISADGTLLAVTATGRSKEVRVYQWSGTAWQQRGSTIAKEYLHAEDTVSISANGKRLALHHGGILEVYAWSGTDWEQLGEELPVSGRGAALSADGNRVAIGGVFPQGSVDESEVPQILLSTQVYYWSGNNWQQLGEDIVAEDYLEDASAFGKSVSLSANGNRLAISVPRWGMRDYVRIYQWSDAKWKKLGSYIFSQEIVSGGDYTQTVALSADGRRLAIGYPDSVRDEGSGLARVYQWSGSDWQKLGDDIFGETTRDFVDFFGSSLSITGDGSRVAIGAPRNDSNGEWSGQTQVYAWSGKHWQQLGGDIEGAAYADKSGSSVSISEDGGWLAIGAPSSDSNFFEGGLVRVYGAPFEADK